MEIILKNISKKYDGQYVLQDINLNFQYGIYGLLGHNGAGKTTLIKILLDLIKPDSGQVKYKSLKDSFNFIGYLPQSLGLDESLTVENYLKYIGKYKDIPKSVLNESIYEFAELFSYTNFLKTKINKLSGGTKQKIKLTQAFLNKPELVILDEPTVGLDIDERIKLKDFLSKYGLNKTIIVSTHIISDIDRIVNNLVILKKGVVCAEGSLKDLFEMIPGDVHELTASNEEIEDLIKNQNIIQLNSIFYEKGRKKIRFINCKNELINSKIVEKRLEDIYEYFQKGV